MRIAYADPPYPGTARRHYKRPEINHAALIAQLTGYDGWALSTASNALQPLLALCPPGVRVAAWTKPWTPWLYKGGALRVIYAWEPVIFMPARKMRARAQVSPRIFDWHRSNGTMVGGVPGAKAEEFGFWIFGLMGAEPNDELTDLFPGSGAITKAWHSWVRQGVFAMPTNNGRRQKPGKDRGPLLPGEPARRRPPPYLPQGRVLAPIVTKVAP